MEATYVPAIEEWIKKKMGHVYLYIIIYITQL